MKRTYSKPEATPLDMDQMPLIAVTTSEEIIDKPEPGGGSGGSGEYGGEVGAPSWGGLFDDDDTDAA